MNKKKTLKPGSKNSTTAKFEKPTKLSPTTKANNNAKASLQGEQKTLDARAKSLKKGFMTQNEALILQKRKKLRKPVI